MLAHSDEGAGPAIVFVHGLSGNRSRWEPVTTLLIGSFRCIRVDLPGHGATAAGGCDAVSAAGAVAELVRELAAGPAVVVGHSLGATVALLHGALHGGRGVVAVDPAPLHVPTVAARLAPYRDGLLGDGFAAAFAAWEAELFPVDRLPAVVRDVMQRNTAASQDVVLSYWRNVLDPAVAAGVQPGFAGLLASLAVPTLVTLAAPPTPEDAAMLAATPAVVEVWDGLGHFPHLLDPERVADRLRAFVASLP